jgi:hypothetical protein
MKTYSAIEKEAGDKRILVNRVFAVSACLGIFVSAAIYIPCVVSSKVAANEASSVSAMRTIRAAQSSYAERCPRKGFAAALSELGPPPGADLIDQQLASGTRLGYSFNMIAAPADASGRVAQYTVLARPLIVGQTGRQFVRRHVGRYPVYCRRPCSHAPGSSARLARLVFCTAWLVYEYRLLKFFPLREYRMASRLPSGAAFDALHLGWVVRASQQHGACR